MDETMEAFDTVSDMADRGYGRHSPSSPTLSSAAIRPETPLIEDPVLGATMLPSSGEGENFMKVFIQEHLVTILQPLAETVQEVKNALRQIRDDTALTNSIAERVQDVSGTHEQKLLLFHANLDRFSDEFRQQRTEMAEVMETHVRLEGVVDDTKVSLQASAGQLSSCVTSNYEVKRMIEDVDSRLRQVQLAVSETNVYHLDFQDRLSEVRNLHDGLNDRHMQMMASLQQFRQSDENTRSVLKRAVATADKHKKDVQRSLTLLDDRMKSAETMLLDTTHKTQSHAKALKQTSSDLKHLFGDMGEVAAIQHTALDKSHEKPAGEIKAVAAAPQATSADRGSVGGAGAANRMGRLEETINQITNNVKFEKEAMNTFKKDIDNRVEKTITEVKNMSIVVEHTSKAIKPLQESVLRMETKVTNVEASFGPVKVMVDKVANDTTSTICTLHDLEGMVEHTKHEIQKTNNNFPKIIKDIHATNVSLGDLMKEHGELTGSIAKVAMRVELGHEYFQGMSKGFQDTHKRVTAGLDGMVPPKTVANRKMLPEIPGSQASHGKSPSPTP